MSDKQIGSVDQRDLKEEKIERLRLRLSRKMLRTCKTYGLLGEGDRIMVAISGGKDSYTLLDLLHRVKKRLPFKIEFVAVHLDQRQPGYDGTSLSAWLKAHDYEHEIISEDTYSIVKELTPPGGTYCAPCSRLRRGILYTTAERLGCNKVALGHHRDDTIETLLMNMFYAGRIQAMPATYRTDDDRFDVIRPLLECGESDIADYAECMQFPILPCNLCGSQDGLKRAETKALLNQLEAGHPGIRDMILASLKHVRPTGLLDQSLLARLNGSEESSHHEDRALSSDVLSPLIQIEG
jgi:tRNA 2-thiocytidine biosynthesis protein TtcA